MVSLHEPTTKKLLLSPLRATGATIRGVGHVTMGIGKGVHWIGNQVSFRRSEEQQYMPEPDWLEQEALKKMKQDKADLVVKKKKKNKNKDDEKSCVKRGSTFASLCTRNVDTKNGNAVVGDFKIFNEKGEKTWKDMEDDTASTLAPSSVDEKVEKVEKEFC